MSKARKTAKKTKQQWDLTSDDWGFLRAVEAKFEQVRDYVRGVVYEYSTGFFLFGEGGIGKSYSVLGELKRLGAPHRLHNSRMTGRGLVEALGRAPSQIHVIEDAESMMADSRAIGVLRSALASQSTERPPERQVTWTALNTRIEFTFTGAIIIISNQDLRTRSPEIRALASRLRVAHLDTTDGETKALMKKIASEGFQYGNDFLAPSQCWDVCEFICQHFESLARRLDLRLLRGGFLDYLQCLNGQATGEWQDLVLARMQERVLSNYKGRPERKAEESEIAIEIQKKFASGKDREREWSERTGLSARGFYRALQRAGTFASKTLR